jgi:hypothetical protein
MVFPITPVLSTFTGADENPLSESGLWATTALRSGASRCQRLSNVAAPVAAASESVWNTTFGANQEAFATIAALPTNPNGINVFVRAQSVGTAQADCYNLSYNVGTGWRFYRMVDETFTALGSGVISTVVAAAGDSFGVTIIGSTLEGWYRPLGGNWVSLGTQDDTTITGSGKIGFSLANSDTGRADNFGGGAAFSRFDFPKLPKKLMVGRP